MKIPTLKSYYIRIEYRLIKLLTLLVFLSRHENDILQEKRGRLGKEIFQQYKGQVAYGLFKGLMLNETSSWSGFKDTGSKILGLYESQNLAWINDRVQKVDLFIDIGAADGYYAIGMIVSGIAERAITYEISEKDQLLTHISADLNKVSERVSVKGEGKKDDIIADVTACENGLVLFDIEGDEFELIDLQLLEAMKHCYVIIEIHGSENKNLQKNFFEMCSVFHNCEVVSDFARTFPRDSYTEKLSDNERGLILSEGRPYSMSWFCLSPKNNLL
jgi:hypothetical protein